MRRCRIVFISIFVTYLFFVQCLPFQSDHFHGVHIAINFATYRNADLHKIALVPIDPLLFRLALNAECTF